LWILHNLANLAFILSPLSSKEIFMTKFLRLPLFIVLSSLILSACVTINVYFPAAAAEKAADRIIDEVWGKESIGDKSPASVKSENKSEKTEPAKDSKPVKPESAKTDKQSDARFWFGNALLSLIPAVSANELDINVSTPAVSSLQASMAARHKLLEPFYRSGGIGFTANGLIGIHDASMIALKSRSEAQRLIAEENADRTELYQEIANANGQPEWEDNIRQIFAVRWIQRAQAGWWYQETNGKWKRK
jgi:uncharacterized protein YdbL (DUF1318 family)